MTLDPVERQLLAELKTILRQRLKGNLRKFVVFGSKARGDAGHTSDLDVAIVVEGLDRDLRREIFDLIADVELKHLRVVSALVYSTKEFDLLLNRERRIALDIVREGVHI